MISKKKKIQIEKIRNYLCNFKINMYPDDWEHYKLMRYDFVKLNEGISYYSQNDRSGNKIVGVGFNMDSPRARKIWWLTLIHGPSFEDVYNGAKSLNEQQIYLLHERWFLENYDNLKVIFPQDWFANLSNNERLAIDDIYFTQDELVKNNSNFYKYIVMYMETGDFVYLRNAVMEVRQQPKSDFDKDIQARRDAQSLMLSTFDCLEYIGKNNRNDMSDDELKELEEEEDEVI